MRPQIIAVGDTLHVAWTQIADSQNVSYMQSIDGGQAWAQLINLNAQPYGGRHVSLTVNRDRIFAGWLGSVIYEQLDIVYTISQDGLAWTPPSYVIRGNTRIDEMVSATMSGDSIYAVYYAYGPDSTGDIPLRFLYSSNMGQAWSNEQTVAYAMIDYCNGLIILKCFGVLFIVWNAVPVPESTEHTTWETQVIVSYDGGLTWSPKTFLSQYGDRPAQTACASCNPVDGSFAVGWMDYGSPGYFYMRMTGNLGYNWGPEIYIANSHYISDPNIEFVGDTLWATWVDHTFASNWQIGYSKSTNRGQIWTEPERMNYTSGLSMTPWLSYDNRKIHLVWQEDALSGQGRDIYYRRFDPDNDIDDDQNPTSYDLLKPYPNPFNPRTLFEFYMPSSGKVTAKIYDILGRHVKTVVNQSMDAGKHTGIWDGNNELGVPVGSGVYFLQVQSADQFSSKKITLLK
jgi:hypothetical protein